MTKKQRRTERVLDLVSRYAFYAGCALLLIMTVVINVDVLARYLWGKPLGWSLDFASYAMIWATFLGVGWLLKEDSHVTMTLITGRLNDKSKAILEVFTSVAGAAVCGIIAWQGFLDSWSSLLKGRVLLTSLVVPRHLILVSIPLGMLLLFLYFLRKAWRGWRFLHGHEV